MWSWRLHAGVPRVIIPEPFPVNPRTTGNVTAKGSGMIILRCAFACAASSTR